MNMATNGFLEEPLDDVLCEGLFDNIEDFLDFPVDDDDVFGMVDPAGADSDPFPPTPPPVFAPPQGRDGSRVTETSVEDKLCEGMNISEDWISKFLDDDANFNIDFSTVAATSTTVAATTTTIVVDTEYFNKEDDTLFQSLSPISVLEQNNSGDPSFSSSSSSSSSSSFASDNNNTDNSLAPRSPPHPTISIIPARARTKRPRTSTFSPRTVVTLPIIPPSCDGPPALPTLLPEPELEPEPEPEPEPEDFAESCPLEPTKNMKKQKLKVKKIIASVNASSGDDFGVAIRKCMHCQITKTPQWRAGPMGPKTLCNACGVRYKSGRLFPEYRPAASPTYVPTLHSNSHKKVVEMRIKGTTKKTSLSPQSCDLLEYIRRRE